jgi:hypothetical protein
MGSSNASTTKKQIGFSDSLLPRYNVVIIPVLTGRCSQPPLAVMPSLNLPEKQLRQLAQMHYRFHRMKHEATALSGQIFTTLRAVIPPTARPVLNHLVATSSLGIKPCQARKVKLQVTALCASIPGMLEDGRAQAAAKRIGTTGRGVKSIEKAAVYHTSKLAIRTRWLVDIVKSANAKKKSKHVQVEGLLEAIRAWAAHDLHGSFKDSYGNPSPDCIYLLKGIGGPSSITKMHQLCQELCAEMNVHISRSATCDATCRSLKMAITTALPPASPPDAPTVSPARTSTAAKGRPRNLEPYRKKCRDPLRVPATRRAPATRVRLVPRAAVSQRPRRRQLAPLSGTYQGGAGRLGKWAGRAGHRAGRRHAKI